LLPVALPLLVNPERKHIFPTPMRRLRQFPIFSKIKEPSCFFPRASSFREEDLQTFFPPSNWPFFVARCRGWTSFFLIDSYRTITCFSLLEQAILKLPRFPSPFHLIKPGLNQGSFSSSFFLRATSRSPFPSSVCAGQRPTEYFPFPPLFPCLLESIVLSFLAWFRGSLISNLKYPPPQYLQKVSFLPSVIEWGGMDPFSPFSFFT